jgi:hypothetical protein
MEALLWAVLFVLTMWALCGLDKRLDAKRRAKLRGKYRDYLKTQSLSGTASEAEVDAFMTKHHLTD